MLPMPLIRAARLPLMLIAVLAVAACGAAGGRTAADLPPPEVVARYGPVQDGEWLIPAVNPGYLTGTNARAEVAYDQPDPPGTIVVDPHARVLYLVQEGGRAIRYGIAVGREGYGFTGSATIRRKAVWPPWTPTANMIRRDPALYGPVAGGLPGGIENPLGARALYLYRGGRDTHYRIHGTNNISTVGRATSAGCIRLFNQDILDLYGRTPIGTPVRVRSLAQSIAAEGELVENERGRMVPLASFPEDVQAQIRAGNIPWPKFEAMTGIAPGAETAGQGPQGAGT